MTFGVNSVTLRVFLNALTDIVSPDIGVTPVIYYLASLFQIFWVSATIFDLITTKTSLNSIFPVVQAKILKHYP